MFNAYNANNNVGGGWIDEGSFGTGGFGNVRVFRNLHTDECIAVKKSNRMVCDMNDTERIRWMSECDIMLRLDHPNIVKGLPVPPVISKYCMNEPVLVMEFCKLGNLRHVLCKSENSCGLSERKVRYITKDTAAAVQYLHSKKIIHRDIKPENIVLSQIPGQRVMYKLIDLGYAKDLSQGGICQSYVGTLQYLAPELVGGRSYHNAVDYWCLGVVVFECIAGSRPFQQHEGQDPRHWLDVITRKSKSHICSVITDKGELRHSDKLPSPNQLCSMSQRYFEQWLRMLLQADPDARGGGVTSEADPTPKCFTHLHRILNTKLIHIYSVPNNEVFSFPAIVDDDSTSRPQLLDMCANIIRSTLNIPEKEQEFITRSGTVAPHSEFSDKFCSSEDEEGIEMEDMVDLFLVSRQQPYLKHLYRLRPYSRRLAMLIENRDKDQLPPDKKETMKHSVYYCNLLHLDFLRLLEAHKAVSLCIERHQTSLTEIVTQLREASRDLRIRREIFIKLCETDVTEFDKLHKNQQVYSASAVKKWISRKTEVNQFINLCSEVEKAEAKYEQMKRKILELFKSFCVSDGTRNEMHKFKAQAVAMCNNLRNPNAAGVCTTIDIINCVEGCRKKFMELAHDVCMQISKLLDCKQEMMNMEPDVKKLLERVENAIQDVNKYQRNQRRDVWSLYSQTVEMHDVNCFTHHAQESSFESWSCPVSDLVSLKKQSKTEELTEPASSSFNISDNDATTPITDNPLPSAATSSAADSGRETAASSLAAASVAAAASTSNTAAGATAAPSVSNAAAVPCSDNSNAAAAAAAVDMQSFNFSDIPVSDGAASLIQESSDLRNQLEEMMKQFTHP